MGFFSSYLRQNNVSLTLNEVETNRRNRFLNELHVNGVDVSDDDEFTVEDDEEAADSSPSDQAQDAADNPEPAEEDNAPMTDPDENIEDEDDFTMQDDDGEDEEPAPVEDNAEEVPADDQTEEAPVTDEANVDANDEEDDFTLQDDDAPAEDNGEEAPADDGSEDDFTMGDDTGGGEEGGEAPAEGDGQDSGGNGGQQQAPAQNAAPADPTDNISDEDVKSSEEQMYDTLSDDQKRIRTLSLKMEFKQLYESILTVIDGINNIPKSLDNIDSIKRVTNYVTKAKNILIDYIQNNFDKNPYLENYAIYIKFMAIFRTVGNVINDLNAQAGKSTDIDVNTDKKQVTNK